MSALHLPLGQVGVVAAAEQGHLLLGQVEFEDLGGRAGQELAVVADDDQAGPLAQDELLEPLQPVEIEVVGRLVEQVEVVPAQQQRAQCGPRGLAAGQRGHRGRPGHLQADVGGHGSDPLVEIGAAQVQPSFQRRGVEVTGGRIGAGQRLGGAVHGLLRLSHAGPPGKERQHGLAGNPVGFLGQVTNRRTGRADRHRPALRRDQPGQLAQQRRLAGPVHADQPDHVTRRDDEVQVGVERPGSVRGRDLPRDDSGTHDAQSAGSEPGNGTEINDRYVSPAPCCGTTRYRSRVKRFIDSGRAQENSA